VSGKTLFVTGKLAAPALRATLSRLSLPFEYEIATMRISVAALMTPAWIARHLALPEGIGHILIPGLCDGDPQALADHFGVPADKGPADLKQLPHYFGQADARAAYGAFDIRIFAEINNVPYLARDEIFNLAAYYRESGADVIDLGLSPDRGWLDEGPTIIAALREQGYRLSLDSLRPDEIQMADAAGVDYVLSLNGSNRHLAGGLRATPVLIPDTPDDLASLDATIAELERLGKPYLVDPILEPIGFGFAASLSRYFETRRKYPQAEMFMGIGNLTELTEADTAGMSALLVGFCQEVGIRNVLTTEVINWAQGVVRETDIARRLMHYAVQQGSLPKHLDSRLLTVREAELTPYTEAELRGMQAEVTDPNYRIFADADWIYVFNSERFVKGQDTIEIFDQLDVEEATHAFYLGQELAKAHIARHLGKNYRQESPLDWGYRTFEESRRGHVDLKRKT
jgi:dihydropteroate synthase-like protein